MFGRSQPFGTASSTNSTFGVQSNSLFGNPNNNNGTNNNTAQSGFGGFTQTNNNNGGGSMFGNNMNRPQGGLFGSNQTQNNSPFGILNNNNNNNSSAGGLFGGGMNQINNTTNSFGSFNKPGMSNGSLFGNNNNNTNNNTSSGMGLFGNQQNVNSFGQSQNNASNMFGNSTNNNSNNNNNGLFGSNSQQNSNGLFGTNNNNMMSSGGLFGNRSNMGSSGGLFGQTNNNGMFGQNSNNSNNNMFGQNNNNNGNTGGLFGQNNNNFNTANNVFGSNNNNSNTGTSLFGQQNKTVTGGLFGQNNNTSNNIFGQNTQQNSMFGNNSNVNSNTNSGSGMFGQQNKPMGGGLFGQSNNTQQGGGLFGQQNQQNQNNSLFGQNYSNMQQNSGLFGQSNQQQSNGLFNQATKNQTGTGPFGQNNSMNNNNNSMQSSGLFGAKPNNTTRGGLFSQNTTQNFSSGGLFSQNNSQQQKSGGLFGNPGATGLSNTAPSGGLFGNKPSTSTTGRLFGSSNTNNNLFQNSTNSGLFGNKPQGSTSLFGNTSAATNNASVNTGGTGLFGSNINNNNVAASTNGTGLFSFSSNNTNANTNTTSLGFGNNAFSTGLFGSKPVGQTGGLLSTNSTKLGTTQQPSTGLFGSQMKTTNPSNTGGALTQQPSLLQQNQITNIGGNSVTSSALTIDESLFTKINIPPSITQQESGSDRVLNIDISRKNRIYPLRRQAVKSLFASKKLLANASLSISDTATNNNNFSNFTNDSVSLSISESTIASGNSNKLLFNPDKAHFKNLIIKRNTASNLPSTGDEDSIKRISFAVNDSKLESDNNLHSCAQSEDSTDKDKSESIISIPLPKTPITPASSIESLDDTKHIKLSVVLNDDVSFTDDGYYISPSLETLRNTDLVALRKISNLVIGHKDYGKIQFLKCVDLSNIPLTSLCGSIINFQNRSFSAYENSSVKPEPNTGINVPARVTLFNCYPYTKGTREPIRDSNHPMVKKHIQTLKNIPLNHFESYDPKSGTYIFTVDNIVVV